MSLYPVKLSITIDGENKTFHDKIKFTQYFSTNPPLQRIMDGTQDGKPHLSFMQGDRYGSICSLLHADIQSDQHHLLKMLSFTALYVFGLFIKDLVSLGVLIYFWVFYSMPLINLSVSVPIPCGF